MTRTQILAAATAAIALIGSTAHAAPYCQAIKHAVEVGKTDKTFAAIASDPDAGPDGFTCKATMDAGRGFFECRAPMVADQVHQRTKEVIEDVQTCLAITPVIDDRPIEVKGVFTVRTTPSLVFVVDGSGYAPEVVLKVIAN